MLGKGNRINPNPDSPGLMRDNYFWLLAAALKCAASCKYGSGHGIREMGSMYGGIYFDATCGNFKIFKTLIGLISVLTMSLKPSLVP